MSADPVYTVWCDAPGCPEWDSESPTTAKDARAAAKREGWAVGLPGMPNRRRDYCPRHAKNHGIEVDGR